MVPGLPCFTTIRSCAVGRALQKLGSRKFRGFGSRAAAAGPSPAPSAPWQTAWGVEGHRMVRMQ